MRQHYYLERVSYFLNGHSITYIYVDGMYIRTVRLVPAQHRMELLLSIVPGDSERTMKVHRGSTCY